MDPVEMLSFLFMLGTLDLGQDYSTERLTPTQLQMLEDLHDFGIVFRPPHDSRRFYPTRLATTLTSPDAAALLDDGSSAMSPSRKGYIILETNHRLYAYTSSPLQIAVLDLFVKLNTRFPNLVSGKLTKDSVQRAIAHGITSDQIISYLSTNAHPQMQKTTPVLPPTVVDQIRLWQIEGDRMKTTGGFLLKNFSNGQEYQETAKYADSLGVLVWKNDAKQLFFASQIDQLKLYIGHKTQEAQANKAAAGK
jgi:transcription initiation factor TFIIH subunit 4